MKTNRISAMLCVLLASGIAACSGESQPTGPGDVLQRVVMADGLSDGPADQPTDRPEGDRPGNGGGEPVGDGTQRERSFDEFLRVQGSYCVSDDFGGCQLFGGPEGNYLGWYDRGRNVTVAVDYAGLGSTWMQQHSGVSYGGQLRGRIIEEPLDNGLARFRVTISGDNVMSYAVQGTNLHGPLAFGFRPQELRDGQNQAALGNVAMEIVFTGPVGSPMPDLMQLIREPNPDQKLLSVRFKYDGQGPMGEGQPGAVEVRDDGSPSGTQGRISVMYDGSMGPVMRSNPADPDRTTATGFAHIEMHSF